MALPVLLLSVLVLIVLAAGAGYLLGASTAGKAPAGPVAEAELAERDAFIEQLRELAWQHRDVSPELSTIMIDEISQRHRRGLPGA